MIKQLWWVALASGLACGSSEQGSAAANDDAVRRGSGTELPAGAPDPGTRAAEELRLLETATGLVVQVERDGQMFERVCTGSCGDVCKGCLMEACQFSGAPSLCRSAAETCEYRCNACVNVNGQGTCDAPACAGDLSCYFVTLGVPEEFQEVVRGESGPGSPLSPPGMSDPAATAAEPNGAEPSGGQPSGAGDGRGT